VGKGRRGNHRGIVQKKGEKGGFKSQTGEEKERRLLGEKSPNRKKEKNVVGEGRGGEGGVLLPRENEKNCGGKIFGGVWDGEKNKQCFLAQGGKRGGLR